MKGTRTNLLRLHSTQQVSKFYLFPKNKKENLDILGKDFCNGLLNYAHYFSSLKVNSGVMKALIQKALFSVCPSLVSEAGRKEVEDIINELQEEEKGLSSKK